jgi:hypothetical protein
LYESIPSRILTALKAEVFQHHINKEMGTESAVFPLIFPTPAYGNVMKAFNITRSGCAATGLSRFAFAFSYAIWIN